MTKRWFIGLASGSTVDGIDAALVETEGVGLGLRFRLAHFLSQPYPRELRELMNRALSQATSPRSLALLHRVLGDSFAAAARLVADRATFPLPQVFAIGCAGHAFWHETDKRYLSTLGLGMNDVVAERTGITTIGGFRERDLAAGGQGEPLSAVIDYLLFHKDGEGRALVHLGGNAGIVYLPGDAALREVVGFQAGPCSQLLDGIVQRATGGRQAWDWGGKLAVQGRCLEAVLERWKTTPFFERRPPKLLPRQEFGEEFIAQTVEQAQAANWSLYDLLCTATHLVAWGIGSALERFVSRRPERILLSGGGVGNGLLRRLLGERLAPVPLETIDAHGIPAQARKALAYAGLAALVLDGIPGSLPGVTGAAGGRLLGQLSPGATSNWARCLAWMARQTPAVPGAAA